MRNWLRQNGTTLTAVTGILVVFFTAMNLFVLAPIHQRFDAIDQRFDDMNQRFGDMNQRFDDMSQNVNQRFDSVNQRLDRLAEEVSELRKLVISIGERVSRNEGQIAIIREQLQRADVP